MNNIKLNQNPWIIKKDLSKNSLFIFIIICKSFNKLLHQKFGRIFNFFFQVHNHNRYLGNRQMWLMHHRRFLAPTFGTGPKTGPLATNSPAKLCASRTRAIHRRFGFGSNNGIFFSKKFLKFFVEFIAHNKMKKVCKYMYWIVDNVFRSKSLSHRNNSHFSNNCKLR